MAKRKQDARDGIFPPRTMTARQEGAAMAAARRPARDWRPLLRQRFGLDGDCTPAALDGVDRGDPDRYDVTDVQHAHALGHVPLWLITPDEVKLLLDYGYDTPAVFRLALLMLEHDPFQEVEGAAFGVLLPSAARSVRQAYDPVADTSRWADDEARFRAAALTALLQGLEERLTAPEPEQADAGRAVEIHQAASAALAPRRRYARARATAEVARAGAPFVVSRHTPRSGGSIVADRPDGSAGARRSILVRPRAMRLTFYLVGEPGGAHLWGMAVDEGGRLVSERVGSFAGKTLSAAKAAMHDLYGIPETGWTDFA